MITSALECIRFNVNNNTNELQRRSLTSILPQREWPKKMSPKKYIVRKEVLDEVTEKLKDSKVVAVVGHGGIGKTTIAKTYGYVLRVDNKLVHKEGVSGMEFSRKIWIDC